MGSFSSSRLLFFLALLALRCGRVSRANGRFPEAFRLCAVLLVYGKEGAGRAWQCCISPRRVPGLRAPGATPAHQHPPGLSTVPAAAGGRHTTPRTLPRAPTLATRRTHQPTRDRGLSHAPKSAVRPLGV
eukprot:scaffold210619_cov28-Tisochrysis_lutea.AAC.7